MGKIRLVVLGACGAWPAAGEACSGYLVEAEGFRVLLDAGYATLPELLKKMGAEDLNAVLISHGHPDHCADLSPLLRARALGGKNPPALPIYSLKGAIDAVLALDGPEMLKDAYTLKEIEPEGSFDLGPFLVEAREMPHFVPSVGFRLTVGEKVLAYTGDAGPTANIPEMARDADVLLAEATYLEEVPERSTGLLSSAKHAGIYATQARVRGLVLTHLWPGTDREAAKGVASKFFKGATQVAKTGLKVEIG